MKRMRGAPEKERFESKFIADPTCGCWLWEAGYYPDGYGAFSRSISNKMMKSHKASWEIYKGPVTDGLHVLHRCDNRACVNPDHLYLGTNAENMRDRNIRGRTKTGIGSRNRHAKLTENQALAIYADRRRNRIISLEYGVSILTVQRIKSKALWKHIH